MDDQSAYAAAGFTGTAFTVGGLEDPWRTVWAYNVTFRRWHGVPLGAMSGQQFIDHHNQNADVGGKWILRSQEEYDAWRAAAGARAEVTVFLEEMDRLNARLTAADVERADLAERLRQTEESRQEFMRMYSEVYAALRRNVEYQKDGSLLICEHHGHEKHEPCVYTRYVPAPEEAETRDVEESSTPE